MSQSNPGKKNKNRYAILIEKIFGDKFSPGSREVLFEREDIVEAAKAEGIELPKNLGDVIYATRYRVQMPASITNTQPEGEEWVIEGRGRAKYAFQLVPVSRIIPNDNWVAIKIPDSTPEIVGRYSLSDEQALLAKVRYNRLIDIFLGVAAYSLQNHLRTAVQKVGQVEIDELYVAVDKRGRQYILPVQAKGGNDQLSSVQTKQDIACCKEKYPDLICRPISAQFISGDRIALFELGVIDNEVRIIEERHYELVPAAQISPEELQSYDR